MLTFPGGGLTTVTCNTERPDLVFGLNTLKGRIYHV